MECRDTQQCFDEITAYLKSEPIGFPLLIHTENLACHHNLMARLESDSRLSCLRLSDTCQGDSLPDAERLLERLRAPGNRVLLGFTQYLMLRSGEDLEQYVCQIAGMSVRGHLIVLLYHCKHTLQKWEQRDPRRTRRVIYLPGAASPLPQLVIGGSGLPHTPNSCAGIHALLKRLESLAPDASDRILRIHVRTAYSLALFSRSVYPVIDGNDVFSILTVAHPELAGCERAYGSDAQWSYLYGALREAGSLTAVIAARLGPVSTLPLKLGAVYDEGSEEKIWLLWLGLKLYGAEGESYLRLVLRGSVSSGDFEERLTLALLDVPHTDSAFPELYAARKRLLSDMPENLSLVSLYCQRTGRFEKDAVYYLTDATETEEHEFLRCLSIYKYSEAELLAITEATFPELNKYLQLYRFTPANMRLPEQDAGLRDAFTQYFQEYKLQKVTNRVWSAFLEKVLQYAHEKPYHHLQARSTLAAQLDKKGTELFFFDALGVEYLSYVLAKCQQYDLLPEVSVGVCQLPSITVVNKDFLNYFPNGYKKIDTLDELKHHSQVYDYRHCKEPLHLFRELEIIDRQLRQIRALLGQGKFEKAVIISDHGASRLAVIHDRQNQSAIHLDEKAEHSGRCCPATEDPHIPYAEYTPNGYAVLANYERFKGGRRANVEVHGGASLEEVIVPLIVITRKPGTVEICFVEDHVCLEGRTPAAITVYGNVNFSEPVLVVNVNGTERRYQGKFVGDRRHARFVMEDIKRSKKYMADFYDGSMPMATGLTFVVEKRTRENTRMGI